MYAPPRSRGCEGSPTVISPRATFRCPKRRRRRRRASPLDWQEEDMTLQHPTDTLDIQALFPDGTQLIGGEWVPARTRETISVINPATGDTLANVPRGGPEDVDDAVGAASDAFPAWRDLSPSRRGQLLLDWASLCREHAFEIDLLERMEVGRPKWGPPGAGGPMAGILTFTAGLADKATGSTLPSMFPDVIGMTLREPYGVCGSIIPWNAPGPNTVNDAGPAIAMGNTIVIKPAEDAPLTPLLLVKLAHEAGIPAGVINVVTGYGPEAGEPLAGHPLVRRMSFTGSPETGRRVMEACARHLIPLHLELGGKSPQVVLKDAPLEKAIPTIARSITLNTGQICAAGSRVVVDAAIREQVVEGLADAFKQVRVGPWYEDVGTRYGLVASVWTRDVGRAVRLARRIEAGQVSINTLWSGGVIGAPFGGYKSSGFGRTVSADSILDYTQVKSVIIDGRA